jgi:hypothetical protein
MSSRYWNRRSTMSSMPQCGVVTVVPDDRLVVVIAGGVGQIDATISRAAVRPSGTGTSG